MRMTVCLDAMQDLAQSAKPLSGPFGIGDDLYVQSRLSLACHKPSIR